MMMALSLVACSGNNDAIPVDVGDANRGGDMVDAGADTADVPDLGPSCAPFAELGPEPVGVRTLQVAGATVEAFYPAEAGDAFDAYDLRDWMLPEDQDKIPDDIAPLYEFPAYRDASPASGSYPVVLFSHGFGGYRLQSSVLVATIASWGYVVLAPEHPERNLTAVLESGVPMTDDSPALLISVLDTVSSVTPAGLPTLDLERVAVAGHSAGGFAAMSIGGDARFDAVVGWATAGFEPVEPFDTPTIILSGGADRIANAAAGRQLYEERSPPRFYASIDNAGHLAFSDICLIGRDEGGVLAIAEDYGVRVPTILKTLGKDGCLPQDRPPEEAWPVINQLTIAGLQTHLRGADPVNLDAMQTCFGELIAAIVAD